MPNRKRYVTRGLLPSLLVALVFACLVTIGGAYRKPHIPPSVERISGIDFPEGPPGDSVYNESTVELQAYDIFVNLEINSSDLIGPGSFTILASNLSASRDNITFVSLEHDYKTVWRHLLPGTYEIRIYWKLDIPIPSAAGKYDFVYSVKLNDAREGDIFDQFFLCLHIIGYDLPTFLGLLFSSFSVCLLLVEKFSGGGNSVEKSSREVGKMTKPRGSIGSRILVEQYRRCSEDIRYLDKLLWELPFATTTVVATVLTLIYSGTFTGNISSSAKMLLLFVLLVFVCSMVLILRKVRFFTDVRAEFARHVENDIAEIAVMPTETRECLKFLSERGRKAPRWVGYRAIHWQYVLYFSLIVALVYLVVLGFL